MGFHDDQRRQDYLEWLYQRAGRTNGLYTGLFLQRGEELARAEAEAFGQPEPAGQIPPDYIDPQHTGADRELLQAFYAACQSEGGTVDEVTLRGIRAAIAADRAQRQPVPPEPGEVQELVEWLRELGAKRGGVFDVSTFCANLTRAAELLSQRHPQPVPVSERPWEREGWCDEQGRCWALNEHLPAWEFHDCADSRKWADLFLPAHALPLPGEVDG